MHGRQIGMWLAAGVLGSVLMVQAGSVTLAWDPSPSPEVTGYKLFYGPADTPGPQWYTRVVNVCTATQYTVEELAVDTLYMFAVQAYGDDGKTSDFSDKVPSRVAGSKPIPSPRVVAVDGEETRAEDGAGHNALDGNPVTFWHTRWSGQDVPRHPHHIVVDLGGLRTVYGIRYLPRQVGGLNGTIVGYEVYVSLDCATWDATPWMKGSWDATATEKIVVQSRGQQGRYLKLVATSARENQPWTSAAEIQIIGGLQ